LQEADFERADLQQARLHGADLRTAKNLDTADLGDVTLTAQLASATTWGPEGFDVQRAVAERPLRPSARGEGLGIE
jgi:uncharacterized protein YjbI with pentapeptide repeats